MAQVIVGVFGDAGSQAGNEGVIVDSGLMDLLRRERDMALSQREWKFRLAGHGYAIRDVQGRQVVTSLTHGTDLGILPAQGI